MENENKNTENDSNESYALLGTVKIDEFTGRKYDAIRMVKCNCPCHEPKSSMMHCFPCCNNGFIEERRYI